MDAPAQAGVTMLMPRQRIVQTRIREQHDAERRRRIRRKIFFRRRRGGLADPIDPSWLPECAKSPAHFGGGMMRRLLFAR
jgi:hypothetical protein